MKMEISIEEKAKRYDEAIKKAKYYYDEGKTIEFANYIASDIFPELKESEDERIRGNIIATIHLYYGEPLDDEAKEMIAWLEKQGEQNPYGQRQECIDCQFNYAGECKGSCTMKRSEQKPAETEKGAKGNEREIPISAWSEEDEARFESCIEVLQTSDGYDTINAKWFKSLKDRAQPLPKQEWSEEDKCMLNNVIDTLKPLSQTTHSGYAINSMIDWLKSLRPQNRLKPSDEQMKQLGWVAEQNKDNMVGNELMTLYKDLKKLRED